MLKEVDKCGVDARRGVWIRGVGMCTRKLGWIVVVQPNIVVSTNDQQKSGETGTNQVIIGVRVCLCQVDPKLRSSRPQGQKVIQLGHFGVRLPPKFGKKLDHFKSFWATPTGFSWSRSLKCAFKGSKSPGNELQGTPGHVIDPTGPIFGSNFTVLRPRNRGPKPENFMLRWVPQDRKLDPGYLRVGFLAILGLLMHI